MVTIQEGRSVIARMPCLFFCDQARHMGALCARLQTADTPIGLGKNSSQCQKSGRGDV
ncbi:MAG: hypothetical protein HC862_01250 [Scytonema sp. RU_4_4]|nr:hypothetical protein [Scytonema sp. RU_4_4]